MKTALLSSILILSSNSASAIWVEKASDSGINVSKCMKPGTNITKCINELKSAERAQKSTAKPQKHTKKPQKDVVISVKDIKDGAASIEGQTNNDTRCLAYSIFREAGNQKRPDQYAVGQVHINRLKEGSWGKTMCKVVFAKSQFSWTLESKMVIWSAKQEEYFMGIAEGLMIDGFYVKKLASNKILHYHATYVNPKWAKQGQAVASAGDHVFYKNVPF